MKKLSVSIVVACFILLGPCRLLAQTATANMPSKVLWIFHEDVKVARGSAHNKVEQGFARFWTKAQVQPFVAMEAISGNATQVSFVSGYESFAAFEEDYQAFGKAIRGSLKAEYDDLERQEAELVNSVRSSVVRFRPDLSYRPDRYMANLPKDRYVEVTVMQTLPEREESFANGAKMYRSVYEKLNIDMPWVVYEAAEGLPSGTYLVITPMKSLKEIDDVMAMESQIVAAFGEEALKSMNKESANLFVSIESNLYSFSPEMSHAPKVFVDTDPEFWTPKASSASMPARSAKKPAK
jgi:hypothetical protein